jgi:hypothetical protein
VRTDHLLSGRSRSCGRRHLAGARIGHLRVVARAANAPSRSLAKGLTAWVCECTCGRRIVVTTAALQSHHPTKHCGCLALKPTAPAAAVVPDRATSAQQALDRVHDEQAPLGRVRRVAWPVEDDRPVLVDFDPFDTGS